MSLKESARPRFLLLRRREWGLLARYLAPHKGRLIGYMLLSVLPSMAPIPVVALIRIAIDRAIPAKNLALLVGVCLSIAIVRIAGNVMAMFLRRFVAGVIQRFVAALRQDLLAQMFTTSREQLSASDIDRLHARIVLDTERVATVSNALFSVVVPSLLTSAGLFVLLTLVSWRLVLISSLVLPIAWSMASVTHRGVRRATERFQRAFEVFSRGVSFVLRHMDLTRMKAYESEELTRQARVLNELSTAAERLFWNHAVHQHSQVIILSMIGVSLLAAGGWQVAQGSITTGELLAFFVGAGFLNTSLATASQATSGVASGSVSLEKLADVLDSASAPAYTGTARVAFAGSFALEDVTFTYGTQVVLRNVSMTAGAGERVAIIGPNGAGKTTLMNVLLGFLRPSGGEVLADGRPYRELDLRQLRRQVGVVMQRPTFFFGSIRDNVAYGHPEASDPDIEVATRLSHAHEFIATLPSGLDTAIGESGVTLSGGECQRLALARALMGQPRALILDEPTNHLDVSVVGSLLESLDHTYGKLTMILVSHDPRIVGFADRVYLLNEGRLSELERGGAVPFATATGSPVATAVVA